MEHFLAISYVPPLIHYTPVPDGTVIPISLLVYTGIGMALLIAWVVYNMVRK